MAFSTAVNASINEFVTYEINNMISGSESGSDSAKDDLSEREKTAVENSYLKEWINFKSSSCSSLKIRAKNGGFSSCSFRSVYWRWFLNLFDEDSQLWVSCVRKHRLNYKMLAKEFESTPRDCQNESSYLDDPLSQDQNSLWQRYFCDEELRSLIKQDVIRTFPGVDFFRSEVVQSTMAKILFVYARSHPHLCYRQGMHEILAPILYVLHNDHTACRRAQETNQLPEDLTEIMDPNEMAADSYFIFVQIMTHLESSYNVSSHCPISGSQVKDEKCESEIVQRLEWIRERLLQVADPTLAQHLQSLDIPFQLFGIRWLRLLFGREFPLTDLLVLWDAIFSTEELYIVNYVVTAMLIAIRDLLIDQDSTSCLSILMKYPSTVNVPYLIQLALHLAHPAEYPVQPNPPQLTKCENKRQILARQLSTGSQKSERRIRWLPLKSLAIGHSEKESSVVEGYTLEDPRLLKKEIDNLRTVIGLVQLKISQYHLALHDAVFQSSDPEALQAWEGLDELRCFLKNIDVVQSNDVEAADEAGEPLLQIKNQTAEAESTVENEPPTTEYRPELKLFKKTRGESEQISGAPMANPLHRKAMHVTGDWRDFPKDFNQLRFVK